MSEVIEKKKPTHGRLPKLEYSGKDLQVRIQILPPAHRHTYTINLKCIGASGAARPSDFNIVAMSQLFYKALRDHFGGVVKLGGRHGVDE